jgi:hypothetical protein
MGVGKTPVEHPTKRIERAQTHCPLQRLYGRSQSVMNALRPSEETPGEAEFELSRNACSIALRPVARSSPKVKVVQPPIHSASGSFFPRSIARRAKRTPSATSSSKLPDRSIASRRPSGVQLRNSARARIDHRRRGCRLVCERRARSLHIGKQPAEQTADRRNGVNGPSANPRSAGLATRRRGFAADLLQVQLGRLSPQPFVAADGSPRPLAPCGSFLEREAATLPRRGAGVAAAIQPPVPSYRDRSS